MKLVIFDCDGTLIDSQHAIFDCMSLAFGSLGLTTPARTEVLGVVGLSLPEALQVLAPRESEQVRRQLVDAYRSGFVGVKERLGHQEPVYDGVGAVVEALSQRPDTVLGIATGKSKRGVARLLAQEGWHGHFVTIQTADDHPSKPHPSMIQKAMAEAGTEPHDTVMIGDTTYDIEMAHGAGASAVGVSWGYHPDDALWAAGAHHVSADCSELERALDQLMFRRRTP